MKLDRTRWTTLAALGLVGLVVGWLLELMLTASGSATIIPPVTLAVALVVISAILVALALPIRRATRTSKTVTVNPFHAMRIVILAKASSRAGALITGFTLGIAVYLLTRPVLPIGSLWLALASVLGGAVLMAAGLVAEHLCTLPPEDGPAT